MTAAGIDCSGLVHISYRGAGRLVPRDAYQQEAARSEVNERVVSPDDLVTYGNDGRAEHIPPGWETGGSCTRRSGTG